MNGAKLRDPDRLLKGTGKKTRHIVLLDPAMLDRPEVRELMARAVASSAKGVEGAKRGRIVVKSESARKRPRRPPATRTRPARA